MVSFQSRNIRLSLWNIQSETFNVNTDIPWFLYTILTAHLFLPVVRPLSSPFPEMI